MINITEKEKCCGCTACVSICPEKCIKMIPDNEGFIYPQVNQKLCIKCGMCEKVCPEKYVPERNDYPKAYTVRTKNRDELPRSTSGGAFAAIAKDVFSKGGVVYGVGFDSDFSIVHKRAINMEQAEEFRGSKYVQSNLNDCLLRAKEDVKHGIYVCFSGTPCQIAGLKSTLGKDYPNLIMVDIVCKGVPSQVLWYKYICYLQNQFHSKLQTFRFRNKTYGYHSATMKLLFENGKEYYASGRVDYMLKSYYKEIASRPSCYTCKFKGTERFSDFTLFDCWHFSELASGKVDDDKGYTNLFVNTPKAARIFERIKDGYEAYTIDTEKAIRLDGIMVNNSAIPHPRRKDFYTMLHDNELNKTINNLLPVSATDRILEKSKSLLDKSGLFYFVKKMKYLFCKG